MEYWIWLRQLKGIGSVIEKKLLEHFGSPANIYQADQSQLLQVEGIGPKLAANIEGARSLDHAIRELEVVQKLGITILTIHDPEYPQQLLNYSKSPVVLYYKGTMKSSISAVGIVGARRCSSYGKQVALEAASYLASHSTPVISGLAKGIDSYAHTGCIKSNGYTVAVVAHGLDQCYPKEHRELMQAIIETGVVVSKYPPDTLLHPEFFPERNALIVGLSSKILIAEAAPKSGALITAAQAKEQNKELFVAPHEIYSVSGAGGNRLIIEGATMYLHPKQLLDTNHTYIESNAMQQKNASYSYKMIGNEKMIADCLANTPKTIEEIARETGIHQLEILELISIMELEGHIQSLPGSRFKSLILT